jgi:hypothetical protein
MGLAVGWATDFRYPVRHVLVSAGAWRHTPERWLRHCQHHPEGTITVIAQNQWGTTKTKLITTFSCANLRR